MKGTKVSEKNTVVEGETVDVDQLRQQIADHESTIADKDEQIFVLSEMLAEYQQKHANEVLAAANLRASIKFERERSNKTAALQ